MAVVISAEVVARERAAASGSTTAMQIAATAVANEETETVKGANAVGSETVAMAGTVSIVGTDPAMGEMAEGPTGLVAALAPVLAPMTATLGAQTVRVTGATKAKGVKARQTRECTRFFQQYRKAELVSVTWWRQSHQAKAKSAAPMRLHQSV